MPLSGADLLLILISSGSCRPASNDLVYWESVVYVGQPNWRTLIPKSRSLSDLEPRRKKLSGLPIESEFRANAPTLPRQIAQPPFHPSPRVCSVSSIRPGFKCLPLFGGWRIPWYCWFSLQSRKLRVRTRIDSRSFSRIIWRGGRVARAPCSDLSALLEPPGVIHRSNQCSTV